MAMPQHSWPIKLKIIVDPPLVFITMQPTCLIYEENFEHKQCMFTIWLIWACPSINIPEFTRTFQFGRPFLGNHYFFLSFTYLCLGEEKEIFVILLWRRYHYREGLQILTFTRHLWQLSGEDNLINVPHLLWHGLTLFIIPSIRMMESVV